MNEMRRPLRETGAGVLLWAGGEEIYSASAERRMGDGVSTI